MIEDFEGYAKYFEMQLEDWVNLNEAPYVAGYHYRIEEIHKFIDRFRNQLHRFINAWLSKHNLNTVTCPKFLTEHLDGFYANMLKKYADLDEAIENTKIEYGYHESSE